MTRTVPKRPSLILLAATAACAFLAFGPLATPLAAPAQALLYVFAAALVMVTCARAWPAYSYGDFGHAEDGLVMSGRAVGTLMFLAAVLCVIALWRDSGLSGLDDAAARLERMAAFAFRA